MYSSSKRISFNVPLLSRFILVVAVLIASACGKNSTGEIAETGKVTLKRTFKSGDVEKYVQTVFTEVSNEGAPSPLPSTKTTLTSDLVLTIGKVADGKAEITQVVSNFNVDADATTKTMMSKLLPKESTTNGVLDSRSMLTLSSSENVAQKNPLLGLAVLTAGKPIPFGIGLPETELSEGEHWKSSDTFGRLGLVMDVENTYAGSAVFEGIAAYRVTVKGSVKMDPSSAGKAQALLGNAKITEEISGEALLDKRDCSILSATTTIDVTTVMDMAGKPMTMHQKFTTNLKRVK